MIRALTSPRITAGDKAAIRDYVRNAAGATMPAFDKAVEHRLDEWGVGFQGRNRAEDSALIEALKEDLDLNLPF